MKLSSVLKYWLPVLVWIGFVFWMSTGSFSPQKTSSVLEPLLRFLFPSISQVELESVHAVTRKLAHIVEFFIGGLLLFRAFRSGSWHARSWRWAILAAISVVLIGVMDELHQYFVMTRNGSLADVGVDFIGGVLAQLFCVTYFQRSLQLKRRVGEVLPSSPRERM